MPKDVRSLGKLIVAKGLKNLPKVQKSPNLVTLANTQLVDVNVCGPTTTYFKPQTCAPTSSRFFATYFIPSESAKQIPR